MKPFSNTLPPSAQGTRGVTGYGVGLPTSLVAYDRLATVQHKAKHDTEFWQKTQDPNFDQGLPDRLKKIAPGTYAPNVSCPGASLKDATIRRGQDIQSSDRQYAATE